MYTQHPLSAAFPAMSETDLQTLTDDVAQNGLREIVVLYEGQIIDGWHRYQACERSGAPCMFSELDDEQDPVAYVKSLNLHRRHLTDSQRAAASIACSNWATVGKPSNSATVALLQTREQMANEADVSVRTIQRAKDAQVAGLGEAVRDGKISASGASELAKQSPELVEQVKNGDISVSEAVTQHKAKSSPVPVECPDNQLTDEELAEINDETDIVADYKQQLEENNHLLAQITSLTKDDKDAEIMRLYQLLANAEDKLAQKEVAIDTLRRAQKQDGRIINGMCDLFGIKDARQLLNVARQKLNLVAV